MQHVVRYTTVEGRDGTHFTDTLDEAVAFVERVRNVEEASDVRLFSMTQVPVSFRTYYQVQVGEPATPPSTPNLAPAAAPADQETSAEVETEAPQASVLDEPDDHQDSMSDSVDADTDAPSSQSTDHAAGPATPPLQSRFGDPAAESAPANGRRLFSRA